VGVAGSGWVAVAVAVDGVAVKIKKNYHLDMYIKKLDLYIYSLKKHLKKA
jgi:hypothetical protein